eukprot:PLAT13150.1.p1 GENE.PLAT13150.1~~PLAT13150.1.p1  ORF type:complete len:281 (-),score=94.72 PLAT13150.1:102-878(-)
MDVEEDSDEGGKGSDGEREYEPTVVFPGDDVTDIILQWTEGVRLGPGLVQDVDHVIACKAGVLRFRPPSRFWVDSDQKRYIPRVDELVIGEVAGRFAGEYYRLDVRGSRTALLHQLAFDGASKRNKPSLAVGAKVYARVLSCSRGLEPELTCEATHGARKDWMTGQSVYGELKGGHCFETTIAHAKSLLRPDSVVLNELGKAIAFECAVGMNGRVWVSAVDVKHVVLVCNAIKNAEGLADSAVRKLVRNMIVHMKRAA